LNLRLSDTIQQTLFNVTGSWYYNTTGWWTALILFLLMAGTQVMAMLLPRIIAKRKTKNVAKLSKNPAQDQNQNTMKMVSIFMMIFTIIMGFMLPAAMGVYWLIGGVISIAQTLITQLIMSKSSKKKGIK
jgi:YidC/Oxa1 family membrane protein insertase